MLTKIAQQKNQQYSDMWDVFMPKQEIVDTCENEKCKIKKSYVHSYLFPSYPTILNLNFNWNVDQSSCADLLKIYISFTDGLAL